MCRRNSVFVWEHDAVNFHGHVVYSTLVYLAVTPSCYSTSNPTMIMLNIKATKLQSTESSGTAIVDHRCPNWVSANNQLTGAPAERILLTRRRAMVAAVAAAMISIVRHRLRDCKGALTSVTKRHVPYHT